MLSRIRHDGKNHCRLLKSSTLMRIVVPVLTHRSDVYERSILTTVHPKTTQRNYGSYEESHGSIQKKLYNPKRKLYV